MKGFPVRPVPVESVTEQLTVVRRRAQPKAVYIARLTVTAVFAYLLALQLPGGSPRSVLAPLTRAAGSAGHPVPHDRQRRPAGPGLYTPGLLAAVSGRRLRPVQLVGVSAC